MTYEFKKEDENLIQSDLNKFIIYCPILFN